MKSDLSITFGVEQYQVFDLPVHVNALYITTYKLSVLKLNLLQCTNVVLKH